MGCAMKDRDVSREQAVYNRQLNRKARKAFERARAERRADDRDKEVAVRMARRFFPPVLYPEGPPLLALDVRYWQARRCGWDVTDKEYATNARGEVCHPMDSLLWYWWTRLHYKQRGQLVSMSTFRLLRRAS